jgi:hypothetical protein
MLVVNNHKKYQYTMRVKKFLESIKKWEAKYGDRVRNNDDGIDYISIYNAFRSLYAVKQLAITGDLVFPLGKREKLLKIKRGNVDFEDIINELNDFITEVEDLLTDSSHLEFLPSHYFMEEYLLNYYEEKVKFQEEIKCKNLLKF